MNKRLVLSFALAVFFQGTGIGVAQQNKVSQELLQKAQVMGVVRVLVRLDVPANPVGSLTREALLAQRAAITTVQTDVIAALARTKHKVRLLFENIPAMAVEGSADALMALERSGRVIRVTEERIFRPFVTESVPLVEADQAWANGFDGAGWAVAILDTGVDSSHPFLTSKVVSEACFSGNSNCPNGGTEQTGFGAGVPCTYAVNGCSHGTHIAGIAAGQGLGLYGVAKGASLIAIQVFSRFTGPNCVGMGEDPCALRLEGDVIAGLDHVITLGATTQIASANMSLGGGNFTDQQSCDTNNDIMKIVIDASRSVGIAPVIASGNNGFTDGISAPACISSAVSVGSATKNDEISSFSNSAAFLSLVAPGQSIYSSVPNGGFDTFSGTSMAAPHVAGAVAILKQKSSTATVDQVLAVLQTTSMPIKDTRDADPKKHFVQCRIRVKSALDRITQKYVTIDIPNVDDTYLRGMNRCGQMVFESFDGENSASWLVSGTTTTPVKNPSGAWIWPQSINGLGEMTGQTGESAVRFRSAFLLSGSQYTLIRPCSSMAIGNGINDLSEIAGTYYCWMNNPPPDLDGIDRSWGFLWRAGGTTVIDTPGMEAAPRPDQSYGTFVEGLNNYGQLVGQYNNKCTNCESPVRGFVYWSGQYRIGMNYPNALATYFYGINNVLDNPSQPPSISNYGQIVGVAYFASEMRAFLVSSATWRTVVHPNAAWETIPYGITDNGQVWGYYVTDDNRAHGFVFNSLLP